MGEVTKVDMDNQREWRKFQWKKLEAIHQDQKDGFEKINGRQRATEKTVAVHSVQIKEVQERPSAVKAIIWISSILGVFIGVATLIIEW